MPPAGAAPRRRSRAPRRPSRRWKQLVVDDVELGLGRDRLLPRAGDDAAVGDPSPAGVEGALEGARVELGGRVRLARPARAGRRLDPLDRDPARRLGGECLEACDDLVVAGCVRPLRGDDAVGVAREEEAPQRRVVGIAHAPAHQTVAWCIVRVSAT